jgi:probable F420-dependent oxidoreductase
VTAVDVVLRGLPVDEVAAAFTAAEAAGFDGVGVTETAGNPFVAAALGATATSRVRVATAIALAFPRSPMDLAYTAWDLQRLSGGRFALGLGSQVRAHVERRFGASFERPALRMRETVQALHAIWDAWETGGELRFEGELFSHTLMPANFRPPPLGHPRPTVLVAAVRERMLETCGAVADGLLAHAFQTPEVLREVTLPALHRGAERAGRDPAALEVTLAPFTALTDADREAARARVAFYGSTPGYRHVLDHHGLGGLFDALHERSRAGDWTAMPGMIGDDVLDLFCVSAPDPDALAAAVHDRLGGLADRIVLGSEGSAPGERSASAVRLRGLYGVG